MIPVRAGDLGKRLGLVGLGTLTVILVVVAVASYALLTIRGRTQVAFQHAASEIRVLAHIVGKASIQVAGGRAEEAGALFEARKRLDTKVAMLRTGDARRGLPPAPDWVDADIGHVEAAWQRLDRVLLDTVEYVGEQVALIDFLYMFNRAYPALTEQQRALVRVLVRNREPGAAVYEAEQLAARLERALRLGEAVLAGRGDPTARAKGFEEAVTTMRRGVIALLDGDARLGVPRVRSLEAREILRQMRDQIAPIFEQRGVVTETAPVIVKLRDTTGRAYRHSFQLATAAERLRQAFDAMDEHYTVTPAFANMAAGTAGLLMVISFFWFIAMQRDQMRRERESKEALARGIAEIGMHLENVRSGDLTGRMELTGRETDILVDAVNFAVEEMRDLVRQVAASGQQFSEAAKETVEEAGRAREVVEEQREEVKAVERAISDMLTAVESADSSAADSRRMSEEAAVAARKGTEAVQLMLDGMSRLQERMQESQKALKRLADHAKEVDEAIKAVFRLSDKIDVVAMNASIQAAQAGEQGRGFGVVAEDVRSLANQVTELSDRIQRLVTAEHEELAATLAANEELAAALAEMTSRGRDAGESLELILRGTDEGVQASKTIAEQTKQVRALADRVEQSMEAMQAAADRVQETSNRTVQMLRKLIADGEAMIERVARYRIPAEESLIEAAPAAEERPAPAPSAPERAPEPPEDVAEEPIPVLTEVVGGRA